MAYANLVSQICADKKEFVQRMRDFLCVRNGLYADYSSSGIGWTIVDSSYASGIDDLAVGDWWVLYSAGESGDEDIYIKFTWSINYLVARGYLSWDAATSTGSAGYYASANNGYSLDAEENVYLNVYGDLDMIIFTWQNALTYCYATMFGSLLPSYTDIDPAVRHTTGAVSSGTDVVLTLDEALPTGWEVGTQVYVRTTHTSPIGTTYIELTEIKAISGLTITVDLTNPYTTSAAVSQHNGYFCQDHYQFLSTIRALIVPDNSTPNRIVMTNYFTPLTLTYFDPESFEDRYMLYDFAMFSAVGMSGIIRHVKKTANHIGDLTSGAVITANGVNYRCFYAFTGQYFAIKEV